jgi:regulator of protease activity HflC (stomatin/prohibitin superfamily)
MVMAKVAGSTFAAMMFGVFVMPDATTISVYIVTVGVAVIALLARKRREDNEALKLRAEAENLTLKLRAEAEAEAELVAARAKAEARTLLATAESAAIKMIEEANRDSLTKQLMEAQAVIVANKVRIDRIEAEFGKIEAEAKVLRSYAYSFAAKVLETGDMAIPGSIPPYVNKG